MPEVNCDNCGKISHKTPRAMINHRFHFCSKRCLYEYRMKIGDYHFMRTKKKRIDSNGTLQ